MIARIPASLSDGESEKCIDFFISTRDLPVQQQLAVFDAILSTCEQMWKVVDTRGASTPSVSGLLWPQAVNDGASSPPEKALTDSRESRLRSAVLQSDHGRQIADAVLAAAWAPDTAADQSMLARRQVQSMLQTVCEKLKAEVSRRQDTGTPDPGWEDRIRKVIAIAADVSRGRPSTVAENQLMVDLAKANIQLWQLWVARQHTPDDSPPVASSDNFQSAICCLCRCLPHAVEADEVSRKALANAAQSLQHVTSGMQSRSVDAVVILAHRPEMLDSRKAGKGELAIVALGGQGADGMRAMHRMLLLNHLTHAPDSLPLLRALHSAAMAADGGDHTGLEDLESAHTIFSNAVYRVDAAYVPEVLMMSEQVQAALAKCRRAEPDAKDEMDVSAEELSMDFKSAAKEFADLQGSVPTFIASRTKIAEITESLTQIMAQSSLPADTRKQAEALLVNCIESEQVRNALQYLSASTARLDELRAAGWPDDSLTEATAILNASYQLVSAFWGVGDRSIRDAVKLKCRQLPADLQAYQDELLYAKSRRDLGLIRANSRRVKDLTAAGLKLPNYGKAIKEAESIVRSTEAAFLRLSSDKARNEVLEDLQEVRQYLADLRTRQLNKYQHFVIDKCKGVLANFDTQWYCTEAEAKKLFGVYQVYSIDQSFLTPEVGRCFNDCVGKLFAKMTPKVLIECESLMGDPDGKLRPEDF